MKDDSVPCLQCYAPTGMRPLDPRAIPPGCVASLVVVCPKCRAARRERPAHPWVVNDEEPR